MVNPGTLFRGSRYTNSLKIMNLSCRNPQESPAFLTGASPFHYDISNVVQEMRLGGAIPPAWLFFFVYERGF